MTTGNRSASAHGRTDPARSLTVEADLERLFRKAWIVSAILIGGFGGWATLFSISGAVIATGTVAVDGKRKLVQHLDGGTIAQIHVKDGALIKAGAALVTLDARELHADLAAVDREIAARSQQITLIESELVGLLELQAKKLVANQRVSLMQRDAAGLAADIAKLGSQKSKIEARLSRIDVQAPVGGWVHNMVTHTVGGVIPPGATIAEIVPADSGLVVEAKLPLGDIDQVRAGQTASVRMTSFNQRTTPVLEGTVELVSADLLRDEAKGFPYYLARIVLANASQMKLGGKALLPGMPTEVLIETDRRSVLSYLTKPLTDQFARAFREE